MQQDDKELKTRFRKLAAKLGGVTTKYKRKLNEALDAIEDRDHKIASLNKSVECLNCYIMELKKEIEEFPAAQQSEVKDAINLNNQIHVSTVSGLKNKIKDLQEERLRYANLSKRAIFKILKERISVKWSFFKWRFKYKLKSKINSFLTTRGD